MKNNANETTLPMSYSGDVPHSNEQVPERELQKLDARSRNLLRLVCPSLCVGEIAGLTRWDLGRIQGYGEKTVDAAMALVEACRDGSVWNPVGVPAKHASEFDSLSDMILETVAETVNLNDAFKTVMRVNLGFLDATECATLEETGNVMHVTRERVRQLSNKILAALKLTPLTTGFSDLMTWAKSFFESHGLEASKAEFVEAVTKEFSWGNQPTPFSLRRILEELGIETVINPRTDFVAWNKDGSYEWVKTYRPPTSTDRRRAAIKDVLQKAGRTGLTIDEIVAACQERFADVKVDNGNVRGCLTNGGNLDNDGTRIIGFLRGKRGEAGTRYTLNIFFRDDETKAVLLSAGEEIKKHIEETGFGVVDVWKTWDKYKDNLPKEKYLPKLGFYMMMREFGAGDLCYKDYPRISYEGMYVGENAYWWELYEYFNYCGHPKASFAQIMSFFVDCLGIQPDIALSCAFNSMELEKDYEATDTPYIIKRPPAPKDAPTMLLITTKKDKNLLLVQSAGKYTIHSNFFDENGHAIYHPTYVNVFMRNLERSGIGFSSEELSQLTDAGWCKKHLKISMPLLLKVNDVRDDLGYGYWREKFKFGDEFYVCRMWSQANKAAFDKWAVAKAKQAGFEFTPYEIGVSDEYDEI